MKKIFFIILIFMCQLEFLHAQDAFLEWADGIGGSGSDEGRSVEVDELGNIYTVGWFEDTVDFDPGAGVFNLISNGGKDIFIQKLDDSGNFVWAKSIGGVGDDRAYSVSYKNWIYITGWFEDTVDFDSGAGVLNLSSNGGKDIFILTIDLSGNLSSAKSIGGVLDDGGLSVTVDMWNSISITGFFSDTVFNSGGSWGDTLISAGGTDAFITKLNPGGSLSWSLSFGGPGNDWGNGIDSDPSFQDEVYVTGVFESWVSYTDLVGPKFALSNGGSDIFIMKLGYGTIYWANTHGGLGADMGNSIVVDRNSTNLIITGSFEGIVDFDSGFGTTNLISNGGKDIFVQKINENSGNLVWANSMGGQLDDLGICVYSNGFSWFQETYITGSFMDTVDFDSGIGTLNLGSAGAEDIFIQKLDESGNMLWVKSIGGLGADIGNGVVTNYQNLTIEVTGSFQNTVDFDPDTGITNLTANGDEDVFVLKLGQCANNNSTTNPIVCDNYTSPSGNYIWSATGVYFDTLVGPATDCNTFLTINLTVDPIDTSVSNFTPNLVANDTGAAYQWIDCFSLLPILADTFKNFSATTNGSYAVILTKNGCIDTSACITINNVGINENSLTSLIDIYPNPTSNKLFINSRQLKIERVIITDVAGKRIKSISLKSNTISVVDIPKGIYFIKLIGKETTVTKKFVKN